MAWYVYGITSGAAPTAAPAGTIGLDDADVLMHGDGDLRVIVSALRRPGRDLHDANLEQSLEAVRRHDEVLLTLSRTRPVIPVRFGTIMPDREAINQLLKDQGGRLSKTLAAVTGADEWVIRIDAKVEEHMPDPEDTEGVSPGHAFFAKRKSQAEARRDARDRAAPRASELHARLSGLARQVCPLPVREPATIARMAYLVDREAAEAFVAAAESTAGVAIIVQGPLPPYRFVDQDAP